MARLELVSAPGKGTTVRVEIPSEPPTPARLEPRAEPQLSPMKKPEKISILIADDHYIVRMGLMALVNTEPDMEVVAEAADGAQALDLFVKYNPDLALLDLRMPVKDGIQTTTEIRSRFPKAQVLMLTAFDGDEEIHKALQAGAQGYVLKSATGQGAHPGHPCRCRRPALGSQGVAAGWPHAE